MFTLMQLDGYRVLKELQSRFEHFMKTGDDSRIPPDLQRVIFITVGFYCSNTYLNLANVTSST